LARKQCQAPSAFCGAQSGRGLRGQVPD